MNFFKQLSTRYLNRQKIRLHLETIIKKGNKGRSNRHSNKTKND